VVKVLYFHSADVVEIMEAEQNGKILKPEHTDDAFYVTDDVKALKLVKRNIFGKLEKKAEPMYICFSDAVVPGVPEFKVKTKEHVKEKGELKLVVKARPIMDITFQKTDLVDPKTFKNTMELAILGNLLKPKLKLSGAALLFIGLIVGFAVFYILGSFGVLSIAPLR